MPTAKAGAFDQNLVGVDPEYRVHVAERLLADQDGPMLELLKTFHQADLVLPVRVEQRPDRELLGARYELFRAA
jgi:putative restriction endonuclease